MQEETEVTAPRGNVCRAVLRLAPMLGAMRTDIVNGIRRMILGALVVQIAAEVAALFAVAKLVAH